MLCPHCRADNSGDALSCTLCGAVLRSVPVVAASPTSVQSIEEAKSFQAWPFQPLPSLIIGLLLVPFLKQMWLPNYIFNFLATLVHEIGHAVFGWLMGMPAIPQVGLLGGGVTPALSQIPLLCVAILAGMSWFAWQNRDERRWFLATVVVMAVYAGLAFTGAAQNLFVAGGVLFEIGGACACFYWVMTARMSVGLERPLYALWGWWMLLNRGSETWLMLHDRSYWDASIVINAGLGEGLVNDLPQLSENLNLSPTAVLSLVLLLCLSALPIAFGLSCLKRLSGR